MEYQKEICKVTDNQIVFPIKDYENIGDSLSSINYNFKALEVYTCNFEYSANNIWNSLFNTFNANSANWINAINTVKSNSGCWQNTYNTVKNLSSVWLKPISLIYPYPLSIDGSESYIINEVTNWINQAFPVSVGNCLNFIVGQELYIFAPQYTIINKVFSEQKALGMKAVEVHYSYTCISRTYNKVGVFNVDLGTITSDVPVNDQFISKFAGLKFIVSANGMWIYDSTLYS